MTPRIQIAVTHLMGSGHLVRMAALARALMRAGAETRLLAGGRPLAHLDLSGLSIDWLPPVQSDGLDYTRLCDKTGAPVSPALMQARLKSALGALKGFAPHLLVTETWPLGRGALRAEFAALAEAARASGARLVASIRDIPEPPSPKKAERARMALAAFDALLVHGARQIHDVGRVWSLPPALPLHYTGYIATPLPPAIPSDAVLVAVGAGSIGRSLLRCAAEAACLSRHPFRLFVGGSDAEAFAARLSGPAIAEPARPDYRARLAGAAASVSLAGYNTATDLLACRTPSLIVPMAEGGEQEQVLRGAALARLGFATAKSDALTPLALAQTIDGLVAAGPRNPTDLPLDGAKRAADRLLTLLAES
ncbi:MAG: glycosyltransferase [Pseudomonadota bacterium]